MNSDLKDKQYLALELTKILYSDKAELTQENIYESYDCFLKQLTNLFENTETILFLKNQVEQLQKENLEFKANNRAHFEKNVNNLLLYLESEKGNMEPVTYNTLTQLIENLLK